MPNQQRAGISSWAVAALTANGVGTCGPDDNQAQAGHIVVQPMAVRGRRGGADLEMGNTNDPAFALRAEKVSTVFSIMPMNSNTDYKAREVEVVQPLMTTPVGGNQGGDYIVEPSVVRRLTELECERLQGYPDGWTDGQTASARYRQLGNSVAVPCVEWIASRLVNKHNQLQGENHD